MWWILIDVLSLSLYFTGNILYRNCVKNFFKKHLIMVEVYNRNVVSNFKYTIKAVTIFISRIVLKRLNADHKLLFRKLEKDLKYYLLLYKLIQLNIDRTWFASYLHDRTHVHSVKIHKITSKAQSNLNGVPQGSILGPILLTFLKLCHIMSYQWHS